MGNRSVAVIGPRAEYAIAAFFVDSSSSQAELRILLELCQQLIKVRRSHRDVGVQITDEIKVDSGKLSNAGIDGLRLSREVSGMILRDAVQLDKFIPRGIPRHDRIRFIGRSVTHDDPLSRKILLRNDRTYSV